MGIVVKWVVSVLCAVALVGAAGAVAGCGKDGGGARVARWERVTSAEVSGDRPVKLYLGSFRLGDRVRLAWVLSGPKDPPVTLTLRIISVKTGTGYGHTVTPRSEPDAIARRDDEAMSLTAIPGQYRIFFSQRFRPARGPGYDLKLTVYTLHSSR